MKVKTSLSTEFIFSLVLYICILLLTHTIIHIAESEKVKIMCATILLFAGISNFLFLMRELTKE